MADSDIIKRDRPLTKQELYHTSESDRKRRVRLKEANRKALLLMAQAHPNLIPEAITQNKKMDDALTTVEIDEEELLHQAERDLINIKRDKLEHALKTGQLEHALKLKN